MNPQSTAPANRSHSELEVAEHQAPLMALFMQAVDSKKLIDEMAEIVNSPGGALEQTCMYLDDQSAGDWMRLCGSAAYQEAYRSMPSGTVAEKLAPRIGGRGLDVIALGCGDGRSEVRLVEALSAKRGFTDLRLHLLDISHTLLTVANEHANERLAGMGVEIKTLHGDFHHLARYGMLLPQAETMNRRRLYTMLGSTVANLNNEVSFFRDALSLAAPGDLCLLDFQVILAKPEQPDEIRRKEPALVGGPSDNHKRWLSGPIRRYAENLKSWEIKVELNTMCPVPGSYELVVNAQVERGNGAQQRYMIFRLRRYDPAGLQKCLASLGWRVLMTLTYGPGDCMAVMLLERGLCGQ